MPFAEKSAWIMVVVTVAAYASYVGTVLSRADGRPLTEVGYVPALVWSVFAAIVLTIAAHAVVGLATRRDDTRTDERDDQINRFGEYVGQSLVVIGGVGALVLALVEADHFWIANALYLGFVLSALLSSLAKIAAYHRGFQPW